MNAVTAGRPDRHARASIQSICDDGGTVEEGVAPDLLAEIARAAGKSGFQPARHVTEVQGPCASCGAGRAPA
jgi:Fe2+ or Zn2+ uptake regulation protein